MESCERCVNCKWYNQRKATRLINGGFDYIMGWGLCCKERKIGERGALYFPKVQEMDYCPLYEDNYDDSIKISPKDLEAIELRMKEWLNLLSDKDDGCRLMTEIQTEIDTIEKLLKKE